MEPLVWEVGPEYLRKLKGKPILRATVPVYCVNHHRIHSHPCSSSVALPGIFFNHTIDSGAHTREWPCVDK